jgi:hypothetical protein
MNRSLPNDTLSEISDREQKAMAALLKMRPEQHPILVNATSVGLWQSLTI